MPKTLLQKAIFTVVTVEDQLHYPTDIHFGESKSLVPKGDGRKRPSVDAWPRDRDIIKISAVTFTLSETLEIYQSFIKPSQPLSEFTKQLTGVTETDLERAVSLTDALQGLLSFCQETVLVCHNNSYVLGILSEQLKECGLTSLKEPYLDTQEIIKRLYPEGKKLSSSKGIANHYQLDIRNLSYPERIRNIFKLICQDLQVNQGILTVEDVQEFMKKQ